MRSMLKRGSYRPGPQELYTAFCAGGIAGERAMIAPGFKSRFGHPSSREPIPGATLLFTVEWHSAHDIPTDRKLPRSSTLPTTPTTAFSFISATVVAGL